jgi:hypothetical protein
MKLIYPILFISIFLNSLALEAQTITSSPYSMYGIGDIVPNGFGQSKAMGGAGIAMSSNLWLNNINPASYHSIDSLFFLLEAGIDGRQSTFSNGIQKQSNHNINFSYFALAFRITPWWSNSLGLAPFSSVGNNINTTKAIEGSSENFNVNLQGTGGINQYYWGNSFKIVKDLYVGLNISYLLGTIKQTESLTSGYFSGSLTTEDKMTLNKLYFNYGIQYSFNINKNIKTTLGGIFGNKDQMGLKHDVTIFGNANDTLEHNVIQQSSFTLPQYFGLGASVKFGDKLLLASDYKFYNWSQSESLQPNVKFVNSTNYCIGAEFMPSTSFRASYIAKMKYRLGGYLNNSYLMIQGQQIRDMGLSAGIGVPISNKFYISLAYQIGQRGAVKNNGLITEKYQTLMFNVSFADIWFLKPKFD